MRAGCRRTLKTIVAGKLVFVAVFLAAVWAVYPRVAAGHADTGPAPLRALPAGLTRGIDEVRLHNQEGHRAYLLGEFSGRGWWYYFPVAIGVKTTLPMLLAAGLGVAAARRRALYPLCGLAAVLGVGMASNLNLGVRHVLPAFAFLAILGAGAFAERRKWPTRLALALLLWHAVEAAVAHPDYLAYFNQIARGREERFLLDSNLDWGQDLAHLRQFAPTNGIETLQLDYFGVTDPAKLGLRAERLRPGAPATGWIAVSANCLLGLARNPADYAWLRARTPVARAGKSIWIYHVAD